MYVGKCEPQGSSTGWWFGTIEFYDFPLGISSSQLTNSIIFQRGRVYHQPVTLSLDRKEAQLQQDLPTLLSSNLVGSIRIIIPNGGCFFFFTGSQWLTQSISWMMATRNKPTIWDCVFAMCLCAQRSSISLGMSCRYVLKIQKQDGPQRNWQV